MKIDWNNFEVNQEATRVCKDILWLYKDLMDEGGFAHNNVWQIGCIDSAYLHVIITDSEIHKMNERLLREGAFIYLICEIDDFLFENRYTLQTQEELRKKLMIVDFLKEEKKLIEIVLQAMENGIKIWDNNLLIEEYQNLIRHFYMTYVVKYFSDLIKKNDCA